MPKASTLSSAQRLERLKKFAWWLDACILIPGTRFRVGIESIVGLIPGIGDIVGALSSGFLVFEAWRMGVSSPVILRMLLNIGFEMFVGIFPIVGDLFDFVWKANQRNFALIERDLMDPVRSRRRTWGFLLLVALLISFMMMFVVSVVAIVFWSLMELIQMGIAHV